MQERLEWPDTRGTDSQCGMKKPGMHSECGTGIEDVSLQEIRNAI